MPSGRHWRAAWIATLALTWPIGTFAIVLDDPANFAVKRTFAAADLGIPANLGGLLFSADGATLYAVGASESNASAVWAVPVTRDAVTDEVTALGPMAAVTKVFDGDASVPGSGIAAGLGLGPAGTFFYVYWDANQLAQRPGGVGGAETQYAMAGLGVPRATTGLTFSPHVTDPATAFGLLQVSANAPELYNVSLTDAGGGLYPPDAVQLFARMPRGEIGGLDYVPMGAFAGDLMYVSWNAGSVYVVDVDPSTGLVIDAGTSMPTLGTTNPVEQRFASDLGQGPWGLEFDPLTGDLFVGTWSGNPTNTIFQIGGPGFAGPTTTTTTLPGDAKLLPGQKLQVKRRKDGTHRLQMLARDSSIMVATPCEVAGELVIEAVGAAAAGVRFPLDAGLWKPIKQKKPEKGCKYRKGPVAATVQIKAGKALKVIAVAPDLGVPLATDPRPVRIEVRHGPMRHCFEFGGKRASHRPDKKLLARVADPATACPVAASPSGAFVD